MDTTQPPAVFDSSSPSPFALSCAEASSLLLSNASALVIDVRKNEAFLASNCTLPGALRRDPAQVAHWAPTLPPADTALVYCVHGHEVSQNTVTVLRQHGIETRFLIGGIKGWREQGLPLFGKAVGSPTRWVTRERPKIDRIACPWLVRRFVDEHAHFLYVPPGQVRAEAAIQNAMPFDVNASVADTDFTHVGDLCSFDAFIRLYRLGGDAALAQLANIVRGADTDQLALSPQAAGLLAVSVGMSRTHVDDLAMLAAMMPLYDALYAWCCDAVAGRDEPHTWKPS